MIHRPQSKEDECHIGGSCGNTALRPATSSGLCLPPHGKQYSSKRIEFGIDCGSGPGPRNQTLLLSKWQKVEKGEVNPVR